MFMYIFDELMVQKLKAKGCNPISEKDIGGQRAFVYPKSVVFKASTAFTEEENKKIIFSNKMTF